MTTVTIPNGSALHNHTRFGVEGHCVACDQPIHAHFGHKGVWVGCPSDRVPVNAPMILMIDRRAAHPSRRATDGTVTTGEGHTRRDTDRPQTDRREANAPKPTPQPQLAPKTSWTVYKAKFPLSHAKVKAIESERDQEVYRFLAKTRVGLSRLELLKAMKATKRTGIVDGAVRRLRVRYKVIESTSI